MSSAKRRRISRQHRRRAKAMLCNPKSVRSHKRPRPNGRKVRVKY